jgi:hypothetical protein
LQLLPQPCNQGILFRVAESIKRGQFLHGKGLPSSAKPRARGNLVEQLQLSYAQLSQMKSIFRGYKKRIKTLDFKRSVQYCKIHKVHL